MTDSYTAAYEASIDDPDRFWLAAADLVSWDRSPTQGYGESGWFADGRMNTCYNAVDRHVNAGRGESIALIHESPVTGSVRQYSFAQLRDEVARVAGMLREAGVVKGDRVLIYMPMIPQTVFAMLACARIGAIHSTVFGGFAAGELAKRIDDAKPRVILAASCGIEPGKIVRYKPLLDEALDLAVHCPAASIILQREQARAELVQGRDHDWEDRLANASPAPCVSVAATDPLYILYTSGTTGSPKGVVRDNGAHAVALNWSMKNVYGAGRDDVFWAASDVGWVVGHSYIVYGPLFAGCTSVLYEGKPVGTPDAGAYWRTIESHAVSIFFTAPTALRAIRREDPDALLKDGVDIGSLKALFLAGERADPDTLEWLADLLPIPVIDHWWQTELGWPAIATCLGLGRQETLFGSAGHPVPGYRFAVLDAEHRSVAPGDVGELVIALPLPPGCLAGLWRNERRYRAAYFERHPGYYSAGDAGKIDADGRVHIMSRIDDIINVAGHRLSTASIEQVIASHPAVAECAVVGMADELKGQVPLACIVTKYGTWLSHDILVEEVVALVRQTIGPIAAFRRAVIVDKLPKTRSGKTLRGLIRDLADRKPVSIPATIEDPGAIDAIIMGLDQLAASHVR